MLIVFHLQFQFAIATSGISLSSFFITPYAAAQK